MPKAARPARTPGGRKARRVLVVEPAGQLYGSERVLLDALDGLAPLPWQVGVCLPAGTPLVEKLRERPVRVFPNFLGDLHRRGKPARLAAALGLLRAAIQFRPDVLYVNQAGTTRIALVVARVLRIPVVTHVRLGEDVAYIEALAPPRRSVPAVLCVSTSIAAQFQPDGPIEPDRLVTLYDPFSLPDSLPVPFVASGAPRFVCLGRLARQKGQDVLLYAWHRFQDESPRARLSFVGAGADGDPFARDLHALAEQLGVTPEWVGFDPAPAGRLVGATALVCPSRYEPLGRVLFEAWAAGTVPVVWAGSGGAAEVVTESGGGILYTEQSADRLADALHRAATLTLEERVDLVERGRRWVRESCDSRAHAQALTDVWTHAADDPTLPFSAITL